MSEDVPPTVVSTSGISDLGNLQLDPLYLSTKSGSSKEIASQLEDDLKGRSRRNRHPNWNMWPFNRITLRRHGEEVDLCADLAVDESFVTTYNTPLEIIECT
ncbi:hypothetical protein F8M41_022276 [Gigaspora margarita]|uniref:Uncharacterized protein n=1 Tax=Gigaspora margarita TaxID=4874 RepID=A0A8H4AFC4_GIGMA|nr:hypothetical protein F8M41_022276 [Gigaspora margarita]